MVGLEQVASPTVAERRAAAATDHVIELLVDGRVPQPRLQVSMVGTQLHKPWQT